MNREVYESPIRGVSWNRQIWLVADNMSLDRVIPVALHEIGGHGMMSITGKKFYDKLMKQIAVLVNTDDSISAIYERVKEETDTTNEAVILEETMAYIIEREAIANNPFWRAVVGVLSN